MYTVLDDTKVITICCIGSVLLLPDCFSAVVWHPHLNRGEQLCFLYLLAGGQLFCLAELAGAVAGWPQKNERTARGRRIS